MSTFKVIPYSFGIERNIKVSEASNEGIIVGSPNVVDRQDTIKSLFNEMTLKSILLLSAPPFSGKTSICQLLEQYIIDNHPNTYVRRLSFVWQRSEKGFNSFWEYYTGAPMNRFLNTVTEKSPLYIIFDECQVTYSKESSFHDFWVFIKGVINDFPKNIHMLLVSSYSELSTISATPVQEEFQKVLWQITNGHVGLVIRTVQSILDNFKERAKIEDQNTLQKEIIDYLFSFEYLQIIRSCRAYVPKNTLSNDESITVSELVSKSIEKEEYKPILPHIIDNLVKKGMVLLTNNKSIRFPSKLLFKLYYMDCFGSPFTKSYTPKSLFDFIYNSLGQIRKSVLIGSNMEILHGYNYNPTTLEYLWQNEFFHAATTLIGGNLPICPNVGKCFYSTGAVDFYCNSTRGWAIEIMREGTPYTIEEHLSRFIPAKEPKKFNQEGIYFDMIQSEKIKSWVVLNFTSKKPKIFHQHLWHILYSADYSKLTIYINKDENYEIDIQ
eukprot:gene1549-1961_t